MGEDTRKKVAREFLEGKWQNDANPETIKAWVAQYYPKGLEEPTETKSKKKK